MIACLRREPITGRVPHFELVFYLTMEAFGKVHPQHKNYSQWDQMTETERELHRNDIADIYVDTAIEFQHSAIIVHSKPNTFNESCRMIELIRKKEEEKGKSFYLAISGDPTHSIPNGEKMEEFSYNLFEEPEKLKDESKRKVDAALEMALKLKDRVELDGVTLCADYCFNTGPFMSQAHIAEFVTPYLTEVISGYHDLGYYCIKHTDGNIMSILDQLLAAAPDAIHSLDPQGGVDIAEVKRLAGDKVCLIGNVNCGLIDTGSEEEYLESARYAIEKGMPGYGYIFSTSNCIYTGMRLDRYKKILKLWEEIANY